MERILLYIFIFYVVTYIWLLISAVLAMLFGLLYGGKLSSFSMFWFVCQNENGTYKWKRKKFSPVPITTMTGERIMGDNVQRTKWDVTHGIAMTVISIVCVVYFLTHYTLTSPFGFAGIMFGILGVWSIKDMLSMLYRRFGSSEAARCGRELDVYNMQSMQGRRPRDISVPLEERVQLSRRSNLEMYQYVGAQYYRALDQRNQLEMKRTISCIEEGLPKENPLHFFGLYYAECVFYYSFVETNQGKAEHYYKLCPAPIEKDMDANGRRIYAYYLYYIKNNPKGALQAVREGLEAADAFSTKGNIPMEKELLYFLRDKIMEEQTNEYEGGTRI